MAIFTDTVNNVKLTFICQQREAESVDLELIDFLPELEVTFSTGKDFYEL